MPAISPLYGPGEAFLCDDWVILFQKRPPAYMEAGGKIFHKETVSPIQYLYALGVYYRPDRDYPISARPFLITSIEVTFLEAIAAEQNGEPPPHFNAEDINPLDVYLCEFEAEQHHNYGHYFADLSDAAYAKDVLMRLAADQLDMTQAPEPLGSLEVGWELVMGRATAEDLLNIRGRNGISGFSPERVN
jgi:hypothetical protein